MYPPKGLPDSVQLWDVAGVPVSVGVVPGCPHFVAAWGSGRPYRYDSRADASDGYRPAGGKRVSELEFRQLITIRQASY